MTTICQQLGENIRLYRQTKGYTLEEFAKKIHKSRSTISKYEKGDIAIDIETLYDISVALGINLHQILQLDPPTFHHEEPNTTAHLQKDYLYLFDGAANRIIKSLLKTTKGIKDSTQYITLFYNVPSFEQYEKCRSLYYGTVTKQDFVTNYFLQNQTNTIERLFICSLNPLECTTQRYGLLSGISSKRMLPVSAKCILSTVPLKEDQELISALLLTKEDIRLTKQLNMFAIDQLT